MENADAAFLELAGPLVPFFDRVKERYGEESAEKLRSLARKIVLAVHRARDRASLTVPGRRSLAIVHVMHLIAASDLRMPFDTEIDVSHQPAAAHQAIPVAGTAMNMAANASGAEVGANPEQNGTPGQQGNSLTAFPEIEADALHQAALRYGDKIARKLHYLAIVLCKNADYHVFMPAQGIYDLHLAVDDIMSVILDAHIGVFPSDLMMAIKQDPVTADSDE